MVYTTIQTVIFALQGQIIHSDERPDQNSCLNLCKSYDDCNWFSFNTVEEDCYLFRECPVIEEYPVFVTGQKECPGKFFMFWVHPSVNSPKNTFCLKNPLFLSSHYGTQDLLILSEFHNKCIKIVNFSIEAYFWASFHT